MDQHLRVLFERALSDEPVPPPGDLAQEAMAGGRRRRRQRLLTGGVTGLVIAFAAAVAVNEATEPSSTPSSTPTAMSQAMSLASRSGCGEPVAVEDEIAVFMRQDVTDRQRADLDELLRSDPRVLQVRYETRQATYEKFKELYRNAPDLLAAVKPGQIPESFRVTLTQPERSLQMEEELRRRPGVEGVVRTVCDRVQRAREGE